MAPLVEEMLQRISGEVGRYERVITYWHVFGPLLEGAVCASLRETTGAVTRQCGLSQARTRPPPAHFLRLEATLNRRPLQNHCTFGTALCLQ